MPRSASHAAAHHRRGYCAPCHTHSRPLRPRPLRVSGRWHGCAAACTTGCAAAATAIVQRACAAASPRAPPSRTRHPTRAPASRSRAAAAGGPRPRGRRRPCPPRACSPDRRPWRPSPRRTVRRAATTERQEARQASKRRSRQGEADAGASALPIPGTVPRTQGSYYTRTWYPGILKYILHAME